MTEQVPRKHNYRHGESSWIDHPPTPEYVAWVSMHARCDPKRARTNPLAVKYYVEFGTKVCARWFLYEDFLADVGRRPSPQHSLDRYPNPYGDYEPGNVRWATPAEQAANRRNNHRLTIRGESLIVSEWARRVGMNSQTLHERLKHGWSPERAVFTPVQQRRR